MTMLVLHTNAFCVAIIMYIGSRKVWKSIEFTPAINCCARVDKKCQFTTQIIIPMLC